MNLFSKIYWAFYPKITTKVVYLQTQICGFNLSDSIVKEKYGLTIKQVDYNVDSDLQSWCDVMNNSYDDCFYTIDKARKFLKDHPLFKSNKTVLFCCNGIYCASVSWGGYKANSIIGGDFRIGVKNEFKKRGLGRMCVEYAFSRLAEEGYKFGESVITIKRVPSLMLHFSLGFVPRYNMKYVTYRDNLKYINIIQRIRLTIMLHKYYKQYRNNLKKKFL